MLSITLSSYAQVIQLPKPQKISCQEIIAHGYYDYNREDYIMDDNYVGETIVFNYGKNKITVVGIDYYIDTDSVSTEVDGDSFIFKYPVTNERGETGMILHVVRPDEVGYIVCCGGRDDLYLIRDLQ